MAGQMTVLALVSTYGAVFGLIMLSALIAPPGQDVAVLTEGQVVATGGLLWWPGFFVTVGAVVFSDLTLFVIGRRCAKLHAVATSERVARLVRAVGTLGAIGVLIARFVPGTRLLVFPAAGTGGLRIGHFLVVDSCAAILWVSLLLWAGTRLTVAPTLTSLMRLTAAH